MEVGCAPEPPVNWQGLLGYLNLSAGKADPRFQGQWHAACCLDEVVSSPAPLAALSDQLTSELKQLQLDGAAAFRDAGQAQAVIGAVLTSFPKAYLEHHRDLLDTCRPEDLFTPFFLARVCEAVIAARTADAAGDLVSPALERLNDFVGYRPTPVLETRRAGEIYDHERFRPVPIYLRGVGVAAGRFHPILLQALSILGAADGDLLEEAQFELNLLDEFALDPRPYDHNHPANRRPNHVFGEWDPHHLDAMGRHRRFVARQTTLDAMLARVDASDADRNERLFEAAAVLAGTMLMASALCGHTPHAHDSGATLSTLVPKIAKLRDSFYERLIATIPGPRGERLRAEAAQLRQPFGGARRDLNQRISRDRALQLQERHLALLYAAIGCPNASRDRAASIATASVRFAAQARSAITSASFLAAQGKIEPAIENLQTAEDLIHRGIACGALADPWSMLGFQGMYPLFAAREDSGHDPRVEELLGLMTDLFAAYSQAQAEAAARARDKLRPPLAEAMTALAGWWDQFAGYEIQDLPRVHGGESAASAVHVADALARWRERDAAGQPPDLLFWRQHLDGFRTPAAFARVVDALLERNDLVASMGLLMAWLSENGKIALEDGPHSFHILARRWMKQAESLDSSQRSATIRKFFELLEANADALWELPVDSRGGRTEKKSSEDSPYESAYEGVTFRDSADDGTEGALLGDSAGGEMFELEGRDRDLQAHFQFLTTVADLWRLAAVHLKPEILVVWRATAADRLERFETVLQQLHATPVPDPSPGLESAFEYDRRRAIKERLIEDALGAALATASALHLLRSRSKSEPGDRDWRRQAVKLERTLLTGRSEAVSAALLAFVPIFRTESLLYAPLNSGGTPDRILQARLAQGFVVRLLEELPRLGLLRETFGMVRTAREMEQNGPGGRRVTEFDRIFPVAVRSTMSAILDLADRDPNFDELQLNEVLRRIAKQYVELWIEHSDSIRLSVLESVDSAVKWERVRGFVQRFGRELFTTAFLQFANLRSILHRGIEGWLDELSQQSGAPETLMTALETDLPREQAVDLLTTVIQALAENYDEFRDYNATTTHSDYGENLHALLDFLRVKAGYERDHWRLKPLVIVHDVLIRRNRTSQADDWRRGMAEYSQPQADRHLAELSALEERHGLRLRTIRDRLEERFVAPLAIDRLSALLAPAWTAAAHGADENDPALAHFRAAVDEQAESPVGVGLDVPPWIERLEEDLLELRRQTRTTVTPSSRLTLEQLDQQMLHDWTKSLQIGS